MATIHCQRIKFFPTWSMSLDQYESVHELQLVGAVNGIDTRIEFAYRLAFPIAVTMLFSYLERRKKARNDVRAVRYIFIVDFAWTISLAPY